MSTLVRQNCLVSLSLVGRGGGGDLVNRCGKRAGNRPGRLAVAGGRSGRNVDCRANAWRREERRRTSGQGQDWQDWGDCQMKEMGGRTRRGPILTTGQGAEIAKLRKEVASVVRCLLPRKDGKRSTRARTIWAETGSPPSHAANTSRVGVQSEGRGPPSEATPDSGDDVGASRAPRRRSLLAAVSSGLRPGPAGRASCSG